MDTRAVASERVSSRAVRPGDVPDGTATRTSFSSGSVASCRCGRMGAAPDRVPSIHLSRQDMGRGSHLDHRVAWLSLAAEPIASNPLRRERFLRAILIFGFLLSIVATFTVLHFTREQSLLVVRYRLRPSDARSVRVSKSIRGVRGSRVAVGDCTGDSRPAAFGAVCGDGGDAVCVSGRWRLPRRVHSVPG